MSKNKENSMICNVPMNFIIVLIRKELIKINVLECKSRTNFDMLVKCKTCHITKSHNSPTEKI